jgi:hypothetical protein
VVSSASQQAPAPHRMSMIQSALSDDELAKMSFFFKHLEQKWCIKKRKNTYVLKNKDGGKLTYTSAYLANTCTGAGSEFIKRTQLLTFLHNALEDGWNIKKKTKPITSTSSPSSPSSPSSNYVFIKKHNGEYKMYEDDEYLTQFMKRNLSLQ